MELKIESRAPRISIISARPEARDVSITAKHLLNIIHFPFKVISIYMLIP